MRVGVVGCGYWGAKHVRVLQQIRAVSAIAAIDRRPDRRSALAASADIATFADLRSALPHVDALIVATPPNSHAKIALQALRAGKSVLVEKPMTTGSASARRLIQLAAERRLTLMVGHTFEYNAAVWALRDEIESGALGELYYIDTARLNLGLYQSDVNVIWDLAAHDISILNYLLRSRPTSVQAWGSGHARSGQEDVAYLWVDYAERGVRAQVHVSWLYPCKVRRVTVAGSRKMALYDDLADQERVRIYDKGVTTVPAGDQRNPPVSYRYGGISAPFIPIEEPLAVQDRHFVDCVGSGRRPETGGENGLAVVQVLEAANQSMRRGRPVGLGAGADPAPHPAGLGRSYQLVGGA